MDKILELIFKLLSKKTVQKVSASIPDQGFIPYVCHYNENTILTKNGELVQIIRIVGLGSVSAMSDLISLREAVREAIKDSIKKNNFALWFTTIRRKKNINPVGEFKDFFSREFDEFWKNKNGWDEHYVNELYISIIIEGIDTSITNFSSLALSFSHYATRRFHEQFLSDACVKLSEVTKNILSAIEDYGAKLLGMKDWEGVLYSEPLRFFGKICNLYEAHYPVLPCDISEILIDNKIAFGDREIEVVGKNNKNFAAIFSLKEYFELSSVSLDKILQLPFEFIITQSFDFTFDKKEFAEIQYHDYILRVSDDNEFRQLSGMADFFETEENSINNYGKLQTTIMIINKTQEGLNKDIKIFCDQFHALGMAIVREDVFMEHCFWSQIPGNFNFLRRQKIINSKRIAGFSSLQSFPAGQIYGTTWGPAVCVLKTVIGTPYFFNFHNGASGHTLILGTKNSGKTVLAGFLIAQARRYDNKIFYFDFDKKGQCLIKALSGNYYDLSSHDKSDPSFLALSPFNSANKNDSQTIEFLTNFVKKIVSCAKPISNQEQLSKIASVVQKAVDNKLASFSAFCEEFNNERTNEIYEVLKIWDNKDLNHVFGSPFEINWHDKIMGFDLSEAENHPAILHPIFFYLLGRIELQLDGSPTIIVIKKTNELIDFIGEDLQFFLDRMNKNNCVVIFVCEDNENFANNKNAALLAKNCLTKIVMANPNPNSYHRDIFGLSEDEVAVLRDMNPFDHHFLLKSGSEAVISSVILEEMPEVERIFSSDQETLSVMQGVLEHAKKESSQIVEPEVWIPQFFEVFEALKKERQDQEKEISRQINITKRKARTSREDYS